MITVRNLTKSYNPDKVVLSDISFHVDPGELIVVMGASGCGKTTLFRCLTQKEAWNQGHMLYDGEDVFSLNWWQRWQIRKQWAYIEEKPYLNRNQTALRIVLGGRWHLAPLWRMLTQRVAMDEHVLGMDYLEKVGLLDKAHMKADHLSGGERQRVAIARALAKGARVIVADEPVSGLDPESAIRVMQDLQNLCRRENVIVLCTLHQLDLAERFASRILGIANGNLIFDVQGRRLTSKEKEHIF